MNYKRKQRFSFKRINHAMNAPPPNRSGCQGRRTKPRASCTSAGSAAPVPSRWRRAPQLARTRSTTLTDSDRRGRTGPNAEGSTARTERPERSGGNLPLAEAGRWPHPRRRRRASSRWGKEEGRGIDGPNGIKSPAAVPPGDGEHGNPCRRFMPDRAGDAGDRWCGRAWCGATDGSSLEAECLERGFRGRPLGERVGLRAPGSG